MKQQLQQLPGVTLGEVVAVAPDGRPIVQTAAAATPVAAVSCLGPATDWRTRVGRRVLVACIDGDPDRPVVLGALDAPPAPPAREPRTLRIAAGEELTIECGKAKIHLRADGRIEIRGEHLVSRSRGPNKVKGGSVHLN
ncbi:MAG: hypothetical protein FJ265_01790 [Planctomycetes bacterium]|nr:hypothetical protein [Planctomycetota bacterium]